MYTRFLFSFSISSSYIRHYFKTYFCKSFEHFLFRKMNFFMFWSVASEGPMNLSAYCSTNKLLLFSMAVMRLWYLFLDI